MSLETKLTAFDHVVFRLTEWYGEKYNGWEQNNLSKLKITKLLFFVTAASASTNDPGLLSTFDNFAALPYGHVESDIQDHMNDSFNYEITKLNVQFKPGVKEYFLNPDFDRRIISNIDKAVANLKTKNPNLINYNQFDLVDLSHRWQSWKTVFSLAKKNGKFSMKIPREMIMNEPKIFA
jgi:hypothetical protein